MTGRLGISGGILFYYNRPTCIVEYRWRATKNNLFHSKFYLYLPKEKKEGKLLGARESRLSYGGSTCLPQAQSFILTRFCVLTWVTKILMAAILNVHMGHIWSALHIVARTATCWTDVSSCNASATIKEGQGTLVALTIPQLCKNNIRRCFRLKQLQRVQRHAKRLENSGLLHRLTLFCYKCVGKNAHRQVCETSVFLYLSVPHLCVR